MPLPEESGEKQNASKESKSESSSSSGDDDLTDSPKNMTCDCVVENPSNQHTVQMLSDCRHKTNTTEQCRKPFGHNQL